MRVLLKRKHGRVYYAGAHGWSPDRSRATVFSTIDNARAAAAQLDSVNLVVLLESSVFPELAIPAISAQPISPPAH